MICLKAIKKWKLQEINGRMDFEASQWHFKHVAVIFNDFPNPRDWMISKVHSFKVRRRLYNALVSGVPMAHEKWNGYRCKKEFLGIFPQRLSVFIFSRNFQFSTFWGLKIEFNFHRPGVSFTHSQAFYQFPSTHNKNKQQNHKAQPQHQNVVW